MSFPEHISKGFNFDEAIEMAELCRRVYKVFDGNSMGDAKALYGALFADDWVYIHSIRDYETDGRCMILQRRNRNQFALAFRGSVMTGGGLELTNLSAVLENQMVEYEKLSREATPPPRDARVHAGYYKPFNSLKDELIFFFEILAGSKLEQKLLADLVAADDEETDSRIAALGAALGVKYGAEVQERLSQQISKTVYQIKSGDLDLTTVSLEQLVAKNVRFHKVLKGQSESGDSHTRQENEPLEIYVTGFSLGGVLATFCVLFLKRYFALQGDFPPHALKIYSVGSPKTGNKHFVEYYNQQLEDFSYRIQNVVDPVVYMPSDPVPPRYFLPLLMPGVDHVRNGDDYYAFYRHVGEAYTLMGMGYQTLDLNLGGPLKFSIPLPYPHGPDGYKDMLIAARARQHKMFRPLQGFTQMLLTSQEERMSVIQKQLGEIKAAITKTQPDKSHS